MTWCIRHLHQLYFFLLICSSFPSILTDQLSLFSKSHSFEKALPLLYKLWGAWFRSRWQSWGKEVVCPFPTIFLIENGPFETAGSHDEEKFGAPWSIFSLAKRIFPNAHPATRAVGATLCPQQCLCSRNQRSVVKHPCPTQTNIPQQTCGGQVAYDIRRANYMTAQKYDHSCQHFEHFCFVIWPKLFMPEQDM